MPPIREYECHDCGYTWEEIIFNAPEYPEHCAKCFSTILDLLPSVTGGYHIKGDNSASIRPKGAGSRPKSK